MERDARNQSKSMLARLMSGENIIVKHDPYAKTASFNLERRELTLPNWKNMSNELYDMLLVHETGHALITPPKDWKKATDKAYKIADDLGMDRESVWKQYKHYLNVIEDFRVDTYMKKKYPGSKEDYNKGHSELWDRDFFGTKKGWGIHDQPRPISDMEFIDRANMYYKGGMSRGIEFSEDEKKTLERIESCSKFKDVSKLAHELYMKDIQEINNLAFQAGMWMWNPFENQTAEGYGIQDIDIDEGDLIPFPFSVEEHDLSEEEMKKFEEIEKEIKESLKTPTVETYDSYEEKLEEMIDYEKSIYYCTMPRPNPNTVFDYKYIINEYDEYSKKHPKAFGNPPHDLYKRYYKKEKPFIDKMVKMFEIKKAGLEYSRSMVAKTGMIDTNKLWQYKTSDDIFKRSQQRYHAKNHGLIMMIDWSGSMRPTIANVFEQVMSLAWFCKRVQIPFEVYSFTSDSWRSNANESNEHLKLIRGEDDLGSNSIFRIRNLLSSRMSNEEFKRLSRIIWNVTHRDADSTLDPMRGTPLIETMITTSYLIEEFQKKNGVDILNVMFLTDGQGQALSLRTEIIPSAGFDEILAYDSRSKMVYDMTFNYGNGQYVSVMNMLRHRFPNVNLIGFDIKDKGLKVEKNKDGYDEHYQVGKDMFVKNKYVSKIERGKEMTQYEFLKVEEAKKNKNVFINRLVDIMVKNV